LNCLEHIFLKLPLGESLGGINEIIATDFQKSFLICDPRPRSNRRSNLWKKIDAELRGIKPNKIKVNRITILSLYIAWLFY